MGSRHSGRERGFRLKIIFNCSSYHHTRVLLVLPKHMWTQNVVANSLENLSLACRQSVLWRHNATNLVDFFITDKEVHWIFLSRVICIYMFSQLLHISYLFFLHIYFLLIRIIFLFSGSINKFSRINEMLSHSYVQNFMYQTGCFVQKNSLAVFTIVCGIFSICLFGLQYVRIETDIVKLWVSGTFYFCLDF